MYTMYERSVSHAKEHKIIMSVYEAKDDLQKADELIRLHPFHPIRSFEMYFQILYRTGR